MGLKASSVSEEVSSPQTREELRQYLLDNFYKKGILPTVLDLRKEATDVIEHEIGNIVDLGTMGRMDVCIQYNVCYYLQIYS